MTFLRTNTYLVQASQFQDGFSFLAGALLPLAFAPLNFYLLAFICPAILFFVLQDCTKKRAFWRGWLFGLGFFAVGVSWVFVSIHVYGNTAAWLAALLTLLFVSFLGIAFALQSWMFVGLFRSQRTVTTVLGFACSWVILEWFRSWFLTGFPWLLLGSSQLPTVLKYYAPVVSVYGVSFIVALLAAVMANIFQQRQKCWINVSMIVVILLGGWALKTVHWSTPSAAPLKVRLIQGDIPQSVKWNPAYLKLSLDRYQQFTTTNWQAQLTVWPEGSIPALSFQVQDYLNRLNTLAKQHHATILVGTGLTNATQQQFYNGIISLGADTGTYAKRHLVPFGEYVPLENVLRGLIGFFNIPMSNFSAGSPLQPPLTVGNVQIAPFLCYEVAYLNLMLAHLPQANLLLTSSDDSWFGASWAAAQQLQISQIRSLEAARQQIVVANDGYTAVINQTGDIIQIAPRNQPLIVDTTVQPLQGSTLLAKLGWRLEFLLLLIISALSCKYCFRGR